MRRRARAGAEASRPWFTRGVAGIGAASLLADLGHEVPTALLPRLVTSLGGSAWALGLIEGVSDGLAGIMRLLGGSVADDPVRRRRAAVGGYAASAALTSLTGAAVTVPQVGALRAAGWAARGLRVPARNALLADAVPAHAYGRAYGFERAMDNLGAIGGPLLALALVSVLPLRTAVLLSVVPGLLAAASIAYAIRHLPGLERRERQPLRLGLGLVRRGSLGRLTAAVAAFEVGNVAATLLILRATELLTPAGGAERATRLALLLYLAYNVAATGTSLLAGRASDRVGPMAVLGGGFGAFVAAYVGFGLGPAVLPVLATAFVLAGVGIGSVETAEHAAVAALALEERRGSAFGVLAAVQSLGNLAASGIAGFLWTTFSPRAAFLYLASWMVAAFILIPRQGRPNSRPLR